MSEDTAPAPAAAAPAAAAPAAAAPAAAAPASAPASAAAPEKTEAGTMLGNADPKEGEAKDTPEGTTTDSEAYTEFTLAEGVTISEENHAEATPVFKELGLNQEQAQKLVDLQTKLGQDQAKGQQEQFSKVVNEWGESSKNDKEFGGDNFTESIATAKLALDKLGTPELGAMMDDMGVGNHPEMIRFMVKVGAMLKEDVPTNLKAPEQGEAKPDRVSILYGK